MGIGLVSGFYKITATYDNITVESSILVTPTILANDIVKFYRNDTHFVAKFIDSDGTALKDNTVLALRDLCHLFHHHLFLAAHYDYVLTAFNPATGEELGFNVTVLPTVLTEDLVKYYKNGSQFVVKVLNGDGTPADGTNVTFNINGVFYTRTVINGTATLNINLYPGKYIITTMYGKYAVGNNVTVLPTLITEDLDMKYLDGSNFTAKTLGILYNRTTDDDGVAKFPIRLNPGKYIITSIWNGYQVGRTITIA